MQYYLCLGLMGLHCATLLAGNRSVFIVREPQPREYIPEDAASIAVTESDKWVEVRAADGSGPVIQFGDRIIVQSRTASEMDGIVKAVGLPIASWHAPNLVVLQAPDAKSALTEASRLAAMQEVVVAHPVIRGRLRRTGPLASWPNDPYFYRQWHLENRDTNGIRQGVDLNVRAAWPFSKGAGVTVAIGDDGVDLGHPELAARTAAGPHYNFYLRIASGGPSYSGASHGTANAGLVAASLGNMAGGSGVAPLANLSSLVIFYSDYGVVDSQGMADMFQYRLDVIGVHSHSWSTYYDAQIPPYLNSPSVVEQNALSNAFSLGRGGRGLVMVQSAGNYRAYDADANDDGYVSDPRKIAVGAVRADGRAASYSTPGACVLVAAPSGELDNSWPSIFTTDRRGSAGYNASSQTIGGPDYVQDSTLYTGTSASTPQIAGLAALLVSANTNLTYRDVQQIFVLSSRIWDRADNTLQTNGAGLEVSHRVGFGVPDAALAVNMARIWPNRPPLATFRFTNSVTLTIPEENGSVEVNGSNLPPALASLRCLPAARGPRADKPTASLPLVDIGLATNRPSLNLTGKAALIQRGSNTFSEKIQFAAAAGAAFAIVFNNIDATALLHMDTPDTSPIPAVFIGQNDGEGLRAFLLTNSSATARLLSGAAAVAFDVPASVLCEHVGVRLQTTAPRRGQLRFTLESPAGTVSVLQHASSDNSAGPSDWTYYSVQHFYENSQGTWWLRLGDDYAGDAGQLTRAELIIMGVPITDANHNSLDDFWELSQIGTLNSSASDDTDGDGYSNLIEFILNTPPNAPVTQFQVDYANFNLGTVRLGWPGLNNRTYQILGSENPALPFSVITNVMGRFPETEWHFGKTNGRFFYRVRVVQ